MIALVVVTGVRFIYFRDILYHLRLTNRYKPLARFFRSDNFLKALNFKTRGRVLAAKFFFCFFFHFRSPRFYHRYRLSCRRTRSRPLFITEISLLHTETPRLKSAMKILRKKAIFFFLSFIISLSLSLSLLPRRCLNEHSFLTINYRPFVYLFFRKF